MTHFFFVWTFKADGLIGVFDLEAKFSVNLPDRFGLDRLVESGLKFGIWFHAPRDAMDGRGRTQRLTAHYPVLNMLFYFLFCQG